VLQAIGRSAELAHTAVRLTLGAPTTEAEVEGALDLLPLAVERLRDQATARGLRSQEQTQPLRAHLGKSSASRSRGGGRREPVSGRTGSDQCSEEDSIRIAALRGSMASRAK
jgi:hypothetical protein